MAYTTHKISKIGDGLLLLQNMWYTCRKSAIDSPNCWPVPTLDDQLWLVWDTLKTFKRFCRSFDDGYSRLLSTYCGVLKIPRDIWKHVIEVQNSMKVATLFSGRPTSCPLRHLPKFSQSTQEGLTGIQECRHHRNEALLRGILENWASHTLGH